MPVKPYRDGIRIRMPNGDLARFHGWNIEKTATKSDLQWLKNNGYNEVRIVVYWKDIEKTEGAYTWGTLDTFMSNLASVGLYGLFEMHQWDWCSVFTGGKGQGIGFPAWMYNGTKYGNYNNDRQKAMDEFYQKNTINGALFWSKFVDLWKLIITRYKDNPCVWAWEIINEPMVGAAHVNTARSACMDRYKEMIPIIRAIDPVTTIILHRIDTGYQKAVDDGNIVWTRSMYPQYSGTGTQTDIDKMKAEFNDTLGVPYIISETGAQPSYQSQADAGLTSMFNRVKTTLNGGNNEVWNCWLYGLGINSGWQGPRNSDGSSSWLHTILAKQLTPAPPSTQFTLTIQTASGLGTSIPSPGAYLYNQGQIVSLTAMPGGGWLFNNWFIDGQTSLLQNPASVTMNANHTTKAIFIEEPPTPPDDSCQQYKDEILVLQALIVEQNTEIAALSTQVTNLSGQISILNQQLTTLSMDNQILQNTISGLKSKMDVARATLVY